MMMTVFVTIYLRQTGHTLSEEAGSQAKWSPKVAAAAADNESVRDRVPPPPPPVCDKRVLANRERERVIQANNEEDLKERRKTFR